MVSESKTVDDIVRIMKNGDNWLAMQQVVMRKFACRIEAAHKREVAELKKELDEWKSNCNFNHADRKKKQKQIAELRECLGSVQVWFRLYFHCDNNPISPNRRKCTTCRLKKCPCHKWRKALEATNGVEGESEVRGNETRFKGC